jgi:predicted kinase
MNTEAKLCIVCGYIASGKTTVADKLAEVTGSDVIRTDDIRKEIFPAQIDFGLINLKNPEESAKKIETWINANDSKAIDFQQTLNPLFSQKEEYSKIVGKYAGKIQEQKRKVYDEAFLKLDKGLEKGRDMLFDATFSKRDMRKRVYQAAVRNGIKKVYIVQVICSESIIKARLANRRSGQQQTTSNAKELEIFRIVKKEFDESRIEEDDLSELSVSRIVYDTGSQEVLLSGKYDIVTEKIRKDVINVLLEKYK